MPFLQNTEFRLRRCATSGRLAVMSLTIGSRIIADTRVQAVALRPVVGGYELVFALYLTAHPEKDATRRASIVGASVSVKAQGGTGRLGFARPQDPFEIVPRPSQYSMSPALVMSFQPAQLAALEDLRGTGDLDFELLATGYGSDSQGEHQIQDQWRIHVPRSDWVKKLRDAKARDILLLEVPMPVGKTSKTWADIATNLGRAQEHFLNGDYHASVGSCRSVVQELGQQKFKKKDWSTPLLTRLASDRGGMTKHEGLAALWATLRHFTHQAHHSGSEGGETEYSRSEAKLMLTLTAAFVAEIRGG